jgi:hypothetical protein
MGKKTNITSTALEKGIDIAKSFVDKLILPSIEETGLLLKDHVTMWKFKNQVRMINKAKVFCEKNNVPLKTISLKLLCPLLDYSSLEEDETLQDKWAILLANMVDSRQNIENHVFPYILSQISKDELNLLEKVYEEKTNRIAQLTYELETFRKERPQIEKELVIKCNQIEEKITINVNKGIHRFAGENWELRKEKSKSESELLSLKFKESSIINKLKQPEIIPEANVKEFELSNLIRLGLVKEVHETYANSQTLEIPNDPEKSYLTVDLDIEVESQRNCVLTELGELFIQACNI